MTGPEGRGTSQHWSMEADPGSGWRSSTSMFWFSVISLCSAALSYASTTPYSDQQPLSVHSGEKHGFLRRYALQGWDIRDVVRALKVRNLHPPPELLPHPCTSSSLRMGVYGMQAPHTSTSASTPLTRSWAYLCRKRAQYRSPAQKTFYTRMEIGTSPHFPTQPTMPSITRYTRSRTSWRI